jgi:hypothetical protein
MARAEIASVEVYLSCIFLSRSGINSIWSYKATWREEEFLTGDEVGVASFCESLFKEGERAS